ncbi:PREDICTED: uncharacterized protein LOC104606938 [Nelumbo nucifera]|uniref:Uncharacterized protein LOC104606938 n=1 Tax=Nelumbo nucifera TaxID=4432 RepID=A0A1U8B3Q0_NELNU|nr:PREDICTED: uncharacterized protein LOC104606938 [Nelumbo nucifera]
MPSCGRSGGFWFGWSNNVSLNILKLSDNAVICSILNMPHYRCWDLLCYYVHPSTEARQRFLNEIHSYAISTDKPWCLYGDLNMISSASEKLGGRVLPILKNSGLKNHSSALASMIFGISLLNELSAWLKREETYWKQRSRISWNVDGGCCTRFFHISVSNRKRRNGIHCLKKSDGSWTSSKSEFEEILVNHFQALFSSLNPDLSDFNIPDIAHSISDKDNNFLMKIPDEREISQILFSMGPWKSPGPDGFPTGAI